MTPDRLAAIDIGTNTIKLLVAVVKDGALTALYEDAMKGKRLEAYTLPELRAFIANGGRGDGDKDNQVLQAKVELHRRFSASLACLAFALVAIPLGITTHRKETSAGFALSLAIAFFYYFFIVVATTLRDNPAFHPLILIWIPNIVFIALGSVLFYRLSKR